MVGDEDKDKHIKTDDKRSEDKANNNKDKPTDCAEDPSGNQNEMADNTMSKPAMNIPTIRIIPPAEDDIGYDNAAPKRNKAFLYPPRRRFGRKRKSKKGLETEERHAKRRRSE
jgi:hypothetical protein